MTMILEPGAMFITVGKCKYNCQQLQLLFFPSRITDKDWTRLTPQTRMLQNVICAFCVSCCNLKGTYANFTTDICTHYNSAATTTI